MNVVLDMYVTLLPVILAGIANMAAVKYMPLPALSRPIDRGLNLRDGRPLFGANKTWKGFWGMIVLSAFFMIAWGWICSHTVALQAHNLLYRHFDNVWHYNLLIGAAVGLAYVLFELPNSFFKRRLRIDPGQTPRGWAGVGFGVFDQIDSLFGCVLVVSVVYPMTLLYYLGYVALGGLTHIVFNFLLYKAKLKREI